MTTAAGLIGKAEFKKRRQQLFSRMRDNSAAIIFTYPHATRNSDSEYAYRPASDMVYLTRFAEPESLALLIRQGNKKRFILFCRPRDEVMEIWNGRRAGPEGAKKDYGANEAYHFDEIEKELPRLLLGLDALYHDFGANAENDASLSRWMSRIRAMARAGVQAPESIHALAPLLHEMRLIKSAAEVRTMRRAARISAQAHVRAMQMVQPGKKEYELEAEIQHHFRRHGCETAYTTIVGAGENACILHYIENNATIGERDLVLIDAGAEFDCYAADITRTFPASGQFSPAQRQLYDLVLKANIAAIKKVKPGNHWNQPHDAAVRVLTKGLIELGLLKGDLSKNLKNESYRRFYMHRTGHWLGMDVHDVGNYKVDGKWRVFKPGMALTIEPGLYISPGKGVAKKWWNIGIRIEDDVVVTRNGCDVLTDGVPKDADAIEALMQKSR